MEIRISSSSLWEGDDNKRAELKMEDWILTGVTNGLLQPNGNDCGAYILIYARLILHNLPVCFLKTFYASSTTASVFSELLRNGRTLCGSFSSIKLGDQGQHYFCQQHYFKPYRRGWYPF